MEILGKNILLRTAEIEDADFILKLRLDSTLNRFLSAVESDVEKQKEWLKKYKEKEILGKEYYFIIENKHNLRFGTVRVYEIQNDSFTWGSWIIQKNSPITFSIESAIMVYDFGFYSLGLRRCRFEVMVENKAVVNFHKKFGACVKEEKEGFVYFELMRDQYPTIRKNYEKYSLPIS